MSRIVKKLTTNLDTVVIASASGPDMPQVYGRLADSVTRLKNGGIIWSPTPGVTVEYLTPSTVGVHDGGEVLSWRTTLGPQVLWSSPLSHIERVAPWLRYGRVMRVDVARDFMIERGEETSEWSGRYAPQMGRFVALSEEILSTWTRGRKSKLHPMIGGSPAEDLTVYRGHRAKAKSCIWYHKTARGAECDAKIPIYADAWAAAGYPITKLFCTHCDASCDIGSERLYARCITVEPGCKGCKGTMRWHPVGRAESRWPSKYLLSKRWEDLKHALTWIGDLRAWDKTPLDMTPDKSAFQPPRQSRAKRAIAGVLKYHADMQTHHAAANAWLLQGPAASLDPPTPNDVRALLVALHVKHTALMEQMANIRYVLDTPPAGKHLSHGWRYEQGWNELRKLVGMHCGMSASQLDALSQAIRGAKKDDAHNSVHDLPSDTPSAALEPSPVSGPRLTRDEQLDVLASLREARESNPDSVAAISADIIADQIAKLERGER